jgi:hypothetical protein
MPRRDLISIDGDKNYGLNVFDTVGIGGQNNPGDVMVIQAMFSYLHELWGREEYTAFGSLRKHLRLAPDGIMNSKTINAIIKFQRFNSWQLISADGKIHPAKYENRNIAIGKGKPLMTITLLHFELWMAEPGLDYTGEIARKFPNVAFWIR